MKIFPFLLAIGLALGGVTAGTGALAAGVVVDDGSVALSAVPALGGTLRPGQTLVVTGTVTNSTAQTADGGTATVHLSSQPAPSRAALTAWLAQDEDAPDLTPGQAIATTDIGELAPGQSRDFVITIDPGALPFGASRLAVHPLSIRLVSGNVELDVTHTAVVWNPDAADPVSLSLAMPMIVPPGGSGLLTAEALSDYTAPDGILTAQLETALAHGVALGVDPRILVSIRILGSSAPESATAWLDRLRTSGLETFALGFADYDPALVSQAGLAGGLAPLSFPIDPALFGPPATQTPLPDDPETAEPSLPTEESLLEWPYTFAGLTWPADGTVTAADLDDFEAAGGLRTILSSTQVDPAPNRANVTIGGHAATVSDAGVSRFLRSAALAATDQDWRAAMVALGAELAFVSAAPGEASVLATLGRDGSVDGPRLEATLSALGGLPWVDSGPLSRALDDPAASASLIDSPEPAPRVATVQSLLDSASAPSESRVRAFASLLDDPTLLTGPRRLALLATLSQSWHADQAGWSEAIDRYRTDNASILSAVRIPDSSMITFPLEKGNLPLAVTNDLDFPVTVYVTVQPERPILDVVDPRVELRVEANSQARAQVPVQSIANGEVRTKVTLTSGTNVPISTPTFVDLNVQAGWETAATVVVAVIVVLLFGAGVARTILRRRAARREGTG